VNISVPFVVSWDDLLLLIDNSSSPPSVTCMDMCVGGMRSSMTRRVSVMTKSVIVMTWNRVKMLC